MQSDVDRFPIFLRYVEEFGESDDSQLKPGTGREWTPYRFCSEDWVLGAMVAKASRTRYEVGLFLCEDHMEFERDSGLKATLSFALADAYFRTGRMSLHFCGPQENQEGRLETGFESRIPRTIREFASRTGVSLSRRREITDEEGRTLYQALVNMDSALRARIVARKVDPVHAAFLVHRGVFSTLSVDFVLRHSAEPRSIFQGRVAPEIWLEFKRELLVLRAGIMAERAEIALKGADSALAISVVGPGERPLSLRCRIATRIAQSKEAMSDVLLMPFGEEEFALPKTPPALAGVAAIVVPQNYQWVSRKIREDFSIVCNAQGTTIIPMPDTVEELDSEALQRLEKCASTRSGVEEQSE